MPEHKSATTDVRPPVRARLKRAASVGMLILLVVLVNAFFVGITFGHGDHYSQMPTLKHYLDASYLHDDWYIRTLDGLNIRHFFVAMMAPIARIAGIPAAFLLAQLAVLGLMTWAFASIGRHLFGERAAWWVALAGMLATFGEGLGFVSLWAYIARPTDFGHAFILMAVALWLRRKYLWAGACLGLAVNIQPLVGAQGAVLLGVAHLLSRPRKWPWLLAMAALSAVAASPSLFYLSTARVGGGVPDMGPVMDAHLFRLTDRVNPALWKAETWAALAGVCVAFAALLRVARESLLAGRGRDAKWLGAVPSVFFLAAIPLAFFLSYTLWFQPLRTGIWPRVIVCVMIGAWCHKQWDAGGLRQLLVAPALASLINDWYFAGFWAIVLVCALPWPGGRRILKLLSSLERLVGRLYGSRTVLGKDSGTEVTRPDATERRRRYVRYALVIAALVSVAAALPYWAKTKGSYSGNAKPFHTVLILSAVVLIWGLRLDLRKPFHAGMAALVMVLFLALRLPGGPLGPERNSWAHVQPWLVSTSVEEDVAQWCQRNLPPGVRLLVPPDSVAFRAHAERPIVVDLKCFPFGAAKVVEWRRRMLDISGFDAETEMRHLRWKNLAAGYRTQDPERILKLGRKYDARIFVVEGPKKVPPNYPFRCLYREDRWAVYRLPASGDSSNKSQESFE